MSGGHFDYKEHHIDNIADEIERLLYDNKDLSVEVITHFLKGVKVLRTASVYAQRIDYLISGDDGQETFLLKLQKELGKV